MSEGQLLEPSFIAQLEVLRRRVEAEVRSRGAGTRVAPRRGSSAEFEGHRAYVPGDDPRRIDWLATARAGSPVVKLFRAEEDAVVRLVLDTSASMDFGEPSKLDVARRLAAALGYLAIAAGQRAQVILLGGETSGPPRLGDIRRGRGGVAPLLRELEAVHVGGALTLARAVDHLTTAIKRPGLFVVLSDFMDPSPVLESLSRARSAGHELALVQVLTPEELDPTLEGDLALVDAESGSEVELTLDHTAVTAYLERLTGLIEELRFFCKRHRTRYLRVRTDDPLEPAITRFVTRSID